MDLSHVDVQSERPRHPIPVDWVSVSNLRIPFHKLEDDGVRLASAPVISAGIGLPKHQRGIHASRTYEAITSVLSDLDLHGIRLGGDVVGEIARKMLSLHSYGSVSRVVVKAEAFYWDKTPVSNLSSLQSFHLIYRADGQRLGDSIHVKDFIGVKVAGMTACPCAKEVIKKIYNIDDTPLPIGTHMQRSFAKVIVQNGYGIKLSDLLGLVRSCFSNRTVEYLKRIDEAKLVADALERPRFVEDVARDIVHNIVTVYSHIPDDNKIFVWVKSLESIHEHNLEARICISFGEARRHIGF
ncbi:GTP cyclohydrolase FolE2 [archaeon HR01]|nr:GTP cyclohydrolase FolE2 [archaeon HR01]